jgi:transcriptional regulator with XRE-family HTH domain
MFWEIPKLGDIQPMPKQTDIAKAIDMSDAYLSQILSGVYEPSKEAAKKFGVFTGREWTDFLKMDRAEIKQALFAAAEAKLNG